MKKRTALANLDIEASIIGSVLFDGSCWDKVAVLDESHFTDPNHKLLWKIISKRKINSQPLNTSLIASDLGNKIADMGGREFLSVLQSYGAELRPVLDESIEKLKDLAQWRVLEEVKLYLEESLQEINGSSEAVLSKVYNHLDKNLRSGIETSKSKRQIIEEILKNSENPETPSPTGIDMLDFLMQGGLVKKRLYGIGALYGRGKTILLGSISDNLVTRENPVKHLYISLETPPEDIELRNTARHLGLNAAQVMDPDDPLHKTFKKNAKKYLDIIEDAAWYEFMPGANFDMIHRFILRAIHRHGIEGVFIDYWQLIGGREKGQSEDGHFSFVANKLAAIARQENIWIVLAVQTDDKGKPLRSESILQASALFLRLQRDPNDQATFFTTEKNNYGRYADVGSSSTPGAVFDLEGPHFRNPDAMDFSGGNET